MNFYSCTIGRGAKAIFANTSSLKSLWAGKTCLVGLTRGERGAESVDHHDRHSESQTMSKHLAHAFILDVFSAGWITLTTQCTTIYFHLSFYYLLTSTSLYVLLQYYAILRESLPYTLYTLYRLPKERDAYLRPRFPTTTENYVD